MNVIWIISDTFRRDHLGCYGNKEIHTPSLDALAAKSVRFDRHYAASFPTMPARADFMTGRWTGCFMQWGPLPAEQVVIAQLLGQKNFHTAAVVDTPFYLRGGMNYDRGFRSFIELVGQKDEWGSKAWRFESDRFASQTFTQAMRWLEQHYKEDFFLLIDTWDPHEPWDAPDYYTELYRPDYDGEVIYPPYCRWQDVPGATKDMVEKARACYCGEITMVDTWIGHLLRQVENMNLMGNTAVIFTTDHGFYFGEHGGLFGKRSFVKPPASLSAEDVETSWLQSATGEWAYSPLYEETIACPLLIYVPGVAPGVNKGLTSAIDLMPTVLDLLEHEIPDWVEGHSLLPLARDTDLEGRKFVVSGHPFINPGGITRAVDGRSRRILAASETTITTNEWSLIYSLEANQSLLYHLPSDSKQEKNVINKQPEVARELHRMLVEFMRETNLSPQLLEPRLELRL